MTGMTIAAGRYRCEDDARHHLISHARRMDSAGINQGKSGNLSVRWRRSDSDGFLVTPTALPYDETEIDDLVWLPLPEPGLAPSIDCEVFGDDAGGSGPEGRRGPGSRRPSSRRPSSRRPSSEWRFHRDIYRARADACAIVHTHAICCTTLACLERVQQHGIPAFHYMIAMAGGDSIRCAGYATFGTQALSDHVVAALSDRSACLIANHGMIATGRDLPAAFALAVECEALARMYWQALQIGEPVILDAAEMARVLERFADYRR